MMKFSVEFKKLTDAVNTVSKAVAVKGTKPILSNLLITANDNNLRFVGTDQEIMMISSVEATVEEGGQFTIPAKLIQEILSSVTVEGSAMVNFELLNSETNETELSCGRSKFNIQIQGAEDFPPVPVLGSEDTQLFDAKCEGLARALKEASVAMSVDEGNPVQKSICVDFSNTEQPMMASTDNKRLAVTTVRDVEIPEPLRQNFIVPARAIPELQKLLDGNDTIKFGLYKDQLLFASEKFQLISRLIEGRFPDYKRVLPHDMKRSVKMNRKDLAQSLKAVNPIARNIANLVHFDINVNETKIWADAKEQGRAESFVSSELNGEPISIAFNAKYVNDFINVIDDEEVIIEMTTASYPGLLRPGNLDSEFKYVVMPMSY